MGSKSGGMGQTKVPKPKAGTRRLMLLRHAKSSWDDASLADHDRPLAPRGNRAAKQMGKFIAERGLIPDHIICSSAKRTLETMSRIERDWPNPVAAEIDRNIYLAGTDELRQRIAMTKGDITSLMVIGHNPDFQQLVLELLDASAEPEHAADIRRKFPTAALAIFDLEIEDWDQLGNQELKGSLVLYQIPRALTGELAA
ncbi:MAG: histidine phosphatase family protein [Alphaproteobacteria bacterium]|nr:histidine phosphatase family protein [Alphaproteobacteria bacterium SS10]